VTALTSKLVAITYNSATAFNVTLGWNPSSNYGGGNWNGYQVVVTDVTTNGAPVLYPVDNSGVNTAGHCSVPPSNLDQGGNVQSGSATCTLLLTTFTSGDSYTFAIETSTDLPSSATSTATAAQVLSSAGTVPSAPAAAATSGIGSVSLLITVPQSDGGISAACTANTQLCGYNVYVGTAAGKESATPVNGSVLLVPDSNSNLLVPGLTNGTKYYFTVTAVNGLGEGTASKEVSATPATGTSAPTGLAATVGTGSVSLTWNAPASNGGSPVIGYYVYGCADNAGSCTGAAKNAALVTGTSYTVTGLNNGTKYDFVVVAENLAGYSVASDQVSATPAVTAVVAVVTLPNPVNVGFAKNSSALSAATMIALNNWALNSVDGSKVTVKVSAPTARLAAARAAAIEAYLMNDGVAVHFSVSRTVSKTAGNGASVITTGA
jgi:hypothetical protein